MAHGAPDLDPLILVRPGTDIADVAKRFEVFEALHHSMQICNPMTDAELDEVIDAVALSGGEHLYDVACGYGEVLVRCAERTSALPGKESPREGGAGGVTAEGIDLSPWMIAGALATSQSRAPDAVIQWVLGEARDYAPGQQPDVAFCLGAEWIWHDFSGTARALANHLEPGGVAVIGAPRLHLQADSGAVSRQFGAIDTIDDMAATLAKHSLIPFHRVDPDDAGWDDYLDRTAVAAEQWRQTNPGQRAEQWIAEQADWRIARERDREVIGWSVWVARKGRATE